MRDGAAAFDTCDWCAAGPTSHAGCSTPTSTSHPQPCPHTWLNRPAPGLPLDQVVVSDHVVLRGRYTAVDVQLYGRAEHDAVTVAAAAVDAAAASGNPMDPQDESRLARYTQQQRQQQLRAGPGVKRQRVQPPMSLPLAPPVPREGQEQGEGGEGSRAWADGALAPAPQLMPPGGSHSLLPAGVAPAGPAMRNRGRYHDGVAAIGYLRGPGLPEFVALQGLM